jgi:hypothetical protein
VSESLKHFEIERRGVAAEGIFWLEVGAIDMGGEYPSARQALTAWAGEQPQEPPLGRYRVIEPDGYLTEFDISETRERVIERVAREARVAYSDGSTDSTSEALDVISDALAARAVDER